jgi:hypothetical protein
MSTMKTITKLINSIEPAVQNKIKGYIGRDLAADEKLSLKVLLTGIFDSTTSLGSLVIANNKNSSDADYYAAGVGILASIFAGAMVTNLVVSIPVGMLVGFIDE